MGTPREGSFANEKSSIYQEIRAADPAASHKCAASPSAPGLQGLRESRIGPVAEIDKPHVCTLLKVEHK